MGKQTEIEAMTEFLLIRHGQTRANATGRWEGWTDSPLNARGRLQAEAVARRLSSEKGHVAAIYSSPLLRALQTAHAVADELDLEPIVVDQLKEIHFGELEGTTLTHMENKFPELYGQWQDKRDMTFQWPGGEQRGAFFRRASEVWRRIGDRHEGESVVIVAHGGTLRACLADMLPERLGEWWKYGLDNAGLSRVRALDGSAQLLALNDTAHLEEASDPEA
jgi:broad specificity phosphatase PhoE